MTPHLHLREDTQDEQAWQEVFVDNEYQLPPNFDANDVIIDIGAHIGSFALACRIRGAQRIYCYEPDRENFNLLCQNVANGNGIPAHVMPYMMAVCGDEKRPIFLQNRGARTACHTTLYDYGEPVCAIHIDEVLKRFPKIRLLKIDCEGMEFPILFGSKELGRCKEICGEVHYQYRRQDWPDEWSASGLEKHLQAQGFSVRRITRPQCEQYQEDFWAEKGV